MVNNGTLHYDHDRDGTHTQLAGCESKFRNLDHDTYIAVRYENEKLTGSTYISSSLCDWILKLFCLIAVSTDIDNKAGWKPCFEVDGVQLPTNYFFGMSATTGDLSDNHDIIAVKLYELDSSNSVILKIISQWCVENWTNSF